jgi:hypothetical protein
MGIRGLVRALEPYRVLVDFPEEFNHETQNGGDDTGRDIDATSASEIRRSVKPEASVVDGPALAYHAYHVALARRSNARNALEAMPGYGEVNGITVDVLNTLQKHGIRIGAIFFDGALPKEKREVRMERLNSYLRQLENYRSLHSASVGHTTADNRVSVIAPTNCFSFSQVPAKLKTLPALPFLVPSVIDALQQTKYRDITSVIPGEADVFCASYAKKHGAMIITSDSDLLAYDLGTHGSVALFKDIEMYRVESKSRLHVARFEAAHIIKRLNLVSLQTFAFAVYEDPHRTFNSCIVHARQLQSDPSAAFIAFTQIYSIDDIDARMDDPSDLSTILRNTDPRVSEWVHNVHGVGELDTSPYSQSGYEDEESATMYLPVLIEDTTRSSAWDVGAQMRALAYSLMLPLRPKTATKEVSRRGNRVTGKLVEHMDRSDLSDALQRCLEVFTYLESIEVQPHMRWHFNAIYLLCQHTFANGRTLPSRSMLRALLRRREFHNDWEYVHCVAQMQAAAYSFRVLYQLLQIVVATGFSHVSERDVLECRRHLDTLPAIPELFDECSNADEASLNHIVDMLFGALGINENSYRPAASTISSKKRKKTRKKEAAQARKGTGGQQVSASNMFSLLSVGH